MVELLDAFDVVVVRVWGWGEVLRSLIGRIRYLVVVLFQLNTLFTSVDF